MILHQNRYPEIGIRSKIELIKRLSVSHTSIEKNRSLINEVLKNYHHLWEDHKKLSEPEKNKWVRNASGTKLGRLLKSINEKILAPHDHMIPGFIFGGLKKRSCKDAVKYLLGKNKQRSILKLDITRFYEQIKSDRIYQFFSQKAGCGIRGAKLFTNLCCVPIGAKENPGNYKSIGRGFSTSSRLAVWSNLDTFINLYRLIQKELKGKDPKIAIYVDDIAITASRVEIEVWMNLYKKIIVILSNDKNQQLPLNHSKTKIVFHNGDTYNIEGRFLKKESFEHLGLQMYRNSLGPGKKTKSKMAQLEHKKTNEIWTSSDAKKLKGLKLYKNYILN